MKRLNRSICRCCAVVAVLLAAAPAARSCDKVLQVWIAPPEVRVFAGQSKAVAAAIACTTTSDDEGRIKFVMQLVDSDLFFEHPSEDSEDDLLALEAVSGTTSATNTEVPVLAAAVLRLLCGREGPSGLEIGNSSEGENGASPAELGLTTEAGRIFFPEGGFVPAFCVDPFSLLEGGTQADTLLALSGTYVGNIDFEPRFPPLQGFPTQVRYMVKSGQSHFEFVVGDQGPLAELLDIAFPMSAPLVKEGPDPAQDGPRPIRFAGEGSFVEVEGSIMPDGTFETAGRGRVAGFQNIAVAMTGTLRGGILEAEYSMGVNGGLPGGFPLVLEVNGAAPAFDDFFEDSADRIEEVAQRLARFDSPFPLGGADFNDLTTRTAANLLLAQAALRFPQTNPEPTLAAFRGIQARLVAFADDLATSRLISRAAAEQAARDAAAAFGVAANLSEEMNGLLEGAPGPALAANIEAWTDAVTMAVAGLDALGAASHGTTFVTVLGGSFAPRAAAPESIVSGFGQTGVPLEAAATVPLPTVLGDASILITDSDGREHTAELLLSSPGQFNYILPEGVATGLGTATVFRGDRILATGFLSVAPVAPNIFTANSSGEGAPAAIVLKIANDGTQTFVNAFAVGAQGELQPALIDLSDPDADYFLQLFGSGFRAASEVVVRIGGEEVSGVAFGASAEFVGLDQANVPLSPALAGKGVAEVAFEADGIPANVVSINLP